MGTRKSNCTKLSKCILKGLLIKLQNLISVTLLIFQFGVPHGKAQAFHNGIFLYQRLADTASGCCTPSSITSQRLCLRILKKRDSQTSFITGPGWRANTIWYACIMSLVYGLCCLVVLLQSAEISGRVYKLGLLTPWDPSYDFSGMTSAAAVDIAIERVHRDPNYNADGQIELT